MNLADTAETIVFSKKPFSLATVLLVALAYATVAKLRSTGTEFLLDVKSFR
jgi:hypothetical protein